MRRFRKFAVFMAFAAPALSAASTAIASSLEKELRTIVYDHPEVRAGQNAVEASRMGIDKARAGYLPKISMSGDVGTERIDNPSTRSSTPGGKTWSRTHNIAGLTISQNLYNGNLTQSTYKKAQLATSVAQLTLEGTRQNTLFQGTVSYINVLRQRRLIELSRNNEINIHRQLNLEDERVQRGSGIAVDVLQAKSRLQLSKERRVSFEGQLEDAVSTYTQNFNHAPDIDAMTDPEPPIEMIPSDLETAIRVAREKNPAISNSGANIEVARESKQAVMSEYSPVVDMVSSWNYEKHKNSTLGTRRDYNVGVRANWDLFTGFTTQAGLAQAAYDYSASMDNFDLATRKVIEQTRLSWQALVTARERLTLLENAVNIAGEVYDSRKKLREAGKETVINVLDAESEVNNAQINFTTASYDEMIAVYQLMLSMGQLSPAYLSMEDG